MFGSRLVFAALLAAAASAQQTAVVKGKALYRERIAAPANAVFEAALEDVSKAGGAAVVLGEVKRENAGQPPYAFSIRYDAGKVQKDGMYAVRVRLIVDGRAMFQSEGVPVLTRGRGRNAGTIVMRRAAEPEATASVAALRETYWKLTRLGDQPVVVEEKQREPHLVFREKGSRVSGNTGCNSIGGTYELNGTSLRFGHMMGTLMACAQGMETENAFRKALGSVRQYRIVGERLELQDGEGKPLAQLQAVALR